MACPPCPAGSYCANPTVKVTCEAGYYCPNASTTPTPCEAGYYCPDASTAPTPCEAGQYSPSSASTSCLVCPGGSYCATPTAKITCEAGFYCPNASTTPMPCPPTKCCSTPNASNYTDCPASTATIEAAAVNITTSTSTSPPADTSAATYTTIQGAGWLGKVQVSDIRRSLVSSSVPLSSSISLFLSLTGVQVDE